MNANKEQDSGISGEQDDSITQMIERVKYLLREQTTDRDRAHEVIMFQDVCFWSAPEHELYDLLEQLSELGAMKQLQEATQASDSLFWPQVMLMAQKRMQEKPQIQLCRTEQRACLATCH